MPDLVIIGAGQAGWRAALAARAVDDSISIALIGDEKHRPYERPPLSKQALAGDGDFGIGDKLSETDEFPAGMDVRMGKRVVAIEPARRRVLLDCGDAISCGRVLLATGSRVRALPLSSDPGRVVYYLRTKDDAMRLHGALIRTRSVTIVGAGFIGLELAAVAIARGIDVRIVDQCTRPLMRVLSASAAGVVEQMHLRRGVEFVFGATLQSVTQLDLNRFAVHTDRGTFETGLVLAGIGVLPNVELAAHAGVEVDNGIVVDSCGRTSNPWVFAAGEVTNHPVKGASQKQRIESWQVAEFQAAAAGSTAAGRPCSYDAWPWFWSDQYGINIQCLGNVLDDRYAVVRGPRDAAHTRFYLDERNVLRGVTAFDDGRNIAIARRMMDAGTPLDPQALSDLTLPWRGWTTGTKESS